MPQHRTDGGSPGGSDNAVSGRSAGGPWPAGFDPEELRRRNAVAVGMDALYLVTTGFFAALFVRGVWPAVIAAVPLAAFLYFGWHSSKPFFATQVLTAVAVAAATVTGVVPL